MTEKQRKDESSVLWIIDYKSGDNDSVGGQRMKEVEVYSVAVGNIPVLPKMLMPKAVKDAIKLISKQEGLIGVTPMFPRGTLLLFDTENHAKGARNELRFNGMKCGKNICKLHIDEKYFNGSDLYKGECQDQPKPEHDDGYMERAKP